MERSKVVLEEAVSMNRSSCMCGPAIRQHWSSAFMEQHLLITNPSMLFASYICLTDKLCVSSLLNQLWLTRIFCSLELLKDEFLNIPTRHISNTLKQQKTLFKAFLILEEQVRSYHRLTRVSAKAPRPRNKRGTELILIERGSRLPKELRAAKKKREDEAGELTFDGRAVTQILTISAQRRKMEQAKHAEAANLEQAKMAQQMGECQCCFTECPLNRMISCGGEAMHLFCRDCPKQYIETEMGQSKCRPVCFASTDCKGTFSRQQLQQVLSDKTFERLEHMQQQQELAAAGLDNLSECPFCDYKMECPPVDVDREFRCQSRKCGKTSCRLCQKETHIPLTCEEASKDGKLTLRHVVEEAMSAALIRKCNKCKHPFVKDHGCNKMLCSHCGNIQWYVYFRRSTVGAGLTFLQLPLFQEHNKLRTLRRYQQRSMCSTRQRRRCS